jgi:hypothetical protein
MYAAPVANKENPIPLDRGSADATGKLEHLATLVRVRVGVALAREEE